MTENLIHEDDDCRIYETLSDGWPDIAGSTRSVRTEWKPGHEPAAPPTNAPTIDPAVLDQVKTDLAAATTIHAVKDALAPLLDALA